MRVWLAAGAGAALGAFLLAGRVLVVADPLPRRAGAIVILAGSIPDRALEAADLYHAGRARRVIVTRERERPGAAALRARGVRLREGDRQVVATLRRLGVPDGAIVRLPPRAESTASEAQVIARWACGRLRTLVAVTSRAHTRRARLILRRTLGESVALSVRPSRYDAFSPGRWWRDRRDAKTVLREYEKLAHYWLRERWTIQPCAETGPEAERTSDANSPRACISRTMSQPPTNFPPT